MISSSRELALSPITEVHLQDDWDLHAALRHQALPLLLKPSHQLRKENTLSF